MSALLFLNGFLLGVLLTALALFVLARRGVLSGWNRADAVLAELARHIEAMRQAIERFECAVMGPEGEESGGRERRRAPDFLPLDEMRAHMEGEIRAAMERGEPEEQARTRFDAEELARLLERGMGR